LTAPRAFSNLPPMTLLLLRRADVHAPEPLGIQDLLIGGGRVFRDKMSIGQYGHIVLAYDTEGNLFGLHSMA
jgi:hypothetical protein